MIRYSIAGIVSGVLFGILDGIIYANPLAQKLFEVYTPIAKTTINAPVGMIIDLAYGFIMAGLFLLLYPSLPGKTGFLKGFSFGIIAWFFRVFMSAASSWMMFNVPTSTLLYSLVTGFGEMLAIGFLLGLLIKPCPKLDMR